jgi:Sodium:sulfate symporter transmembrane region
MQQRLAVVVVAVIALLLLPQSDDLSVTGQRMLAVICIAVVVWITDALAYAVSAMVIAILWGLSPEPVPQSGPGAVHVASPSPLGTPMHSRCGLRAAGICEVLIGPEEERTSMVGWRNVVRKARIVTEARAGTLPARGPVAPVTPRAGVRPLGWLTGHPRSPGPRALVPQQCRRV